MVIELKPCPFCGSNQNFIYSRTSTMPGIAADYAVQCVPCGTRGPLSTQRGRCVELWNRRENAIPAFTILERYDILAAQRGWLPGNLSDVSQTPDLNDVRLAAERCRIQFPTLAHELDCEVAWRETQRHIEEITKSFARPE